MPGSLRTPAGQTARFYSFCDYSEIHIKVNTRGHIISAVTLVSNITASTIDAIIRTMPYSNSRLS